MSDNTQVLTIFEPQNVQTLAQLAPRSYNENQLSHTRCLEAGRLLLEQIQREGMTDALDIEVAKFIEKAKITVKKMNSRRTPVTQLFDRIRRAYTTMENDVDPTKSTSIPAQLQALRNAFAQKKHEQAEAPVAPNSPALQRKTPRHATVPTSKEITSANSTPLSMSASTN